MLFQKIKPVQTIGTLLSDTLAVDSSANYQINSAPGFIYNYAGSKLNVSGGDASYNNYFYYKNDPLHYSQIPIWEVSIDVLITVIDPSNQGFGIRTFSQNTTADLSVALVFNLFSGGGTLYLVIFTPSQTIESSVSFTPPVTFIGNTYRFTLSRNDYIYTATILDPVLGTSASCNYSNNYNTIDNISSFGFFSKAGSQSYSNFLISSPLNAGIPILDIGDSITAGVGATLAADRIPALLASGNARFATYCAGSGNKTIDVINFFPQLPILNPKWVILIIGVNDALNAVPFATTQANYISIINKFRSLGIGIVLCSPIACNSVDMSSYNSFLQSSFPYDYFVDLYHFTKDISGTGLKSAFDSGDGIHGNNVCYTNVVTYIISLCPQIYY